MPAQAFGALDGQWFYFRFRSDHARVEVGPYDAALALALERRRLMWRAVRRDDIPESHRFDADGRESFEWELATDRDLERALDMDGPEYGFVPTRVTARADVHGVTGERFGSSCSDDEFLVLFQRLIDNLQQYPEDEQVDPHTIAYLTEGGLWPPPTIREDTIVSTPDL
ncbi:hypothetical protein ACWGJ9_10065 [Curtobacterium citreum]